MSSRTISRRDVIQSAAALPLLGALPVEGAGRWVPNGDSRSLVVVEFAGGNDGLNTVIPIEDPVWGRVRPLLSKVRGGAHKIEGGFALHPGLAEVGGLLRDGFAAIVHGVGYPDSSRSHFKSRDIWHTADVKFDKMKVDTTGWLGRAVDVLAQGGAAVPGLSVGSLQVPLMLKSREIVVPSLNRIEEYQILVSGGAKLKKGQREDLVELIQKASGGKRLGDRDSRGLRGFLSEVATGAVDNAEKLRASLARYRPKARYPETTLGRRFQLLARILISGFGTRLFHVNFSGFDTHASQLASHAGLMQQFSKAVDALVRDLRGHGKLEDVLIMVQSEFGRRVAQNNSRGTDHGKAGPMFFFGGGIKPGLHGKHPSLTKLEGGDLKPTIDFRKLYATALRHLDISPKGILDQKNVLASLLPARK